ncbi:hypothetical protein Tcan_05196 [Toxocara canis]|uniref:Uncharacterized protein n=1 Tax=Toxocara canis TaxID=6265 RepID=A0A0B2V3J1_TOXCA|nr:hypothetical protein Tcan_05196 [Toxocara canis]
MPSKINRVQLELFQFRFSLEKQDLPEPKGQPIMVQEKIYVPIKEHPDVSKYFTAFHFFCTVRM